MTEVLPHGDAAYNLARWLSGNEADARDIVQESFARALQYFGGFRGGDARAWLLQIVRNTTYSWFKSRTSAPRAEQHDTDEPMETPPGSAAPQGADPLGAAIGDEEARALRRSIAELPAEFREVLVLREFEDMAYRDIAAIVGCPIGTVMSRLARARDALGERMRAEARST
jgi:RNA polymerase sigma-70 factor (ECF subfamily)